MAHAELQPAEDRSARFDAAAYCAAAAAALGLVVPPDAKAGVIANLERTFAFARQLAEADLDAAEPGPVFRPPGSGREG